MDIEKILPIGSVWVRPGYTATIRLYDKLRGMVWYDRTDTSDGYTSNYPIYVDRPSYNGDTGWFLHVYKPLEVPDFEIREVLYL